MVEVTVQFSKGTRQEHSVAVDVIECPSCNGALGLDVSWIEQKSNGTVVCPYCNMTIDIVRLG